MQIEITQLRNRSRRQLIKQTIEKVCNLIMSDSSLSSIKKIKVVVVRGLKDSDGDSIQGQVDDTSDNSVFTMSLEGRLNRTDTKRILAHELGHINQFAEGRLIAGRGKFFWKRQNKMISYSASEEVYEEYYNRPWEVEARSIAEAFLKLEIV